ncbi:TANC2, partial [Symbiodinium pilosum]
TGPTDHELRSRYSGETFDVCFCDGMCTATENWFKVGQLRFAPFQPVSAASNISVLQEEFILEYMNTPGTFGFYRPWIDYGVMGLQEGGALKLVSDPDLTLTDAGCVAATYDTTLVDPSTLTIQNAPTAYSGRTNAATDMNKLVFNNGILANTITVNKAGFISVCYCARPVLDTPGVCAHDQWVLVNRLTIRGPGPGQSWTVSTNVVFRIEYTGWGLAKDDKIRIIPATSQCSDVNGNPRAAWGVTSIKVGCPHPCSEVGEINDVLNGDISVGVLAADTYMCDIQNADCRTNDIKAVTVLDDSTTELEFEASSGLSDGDLITLGENFACAPGQSNIVCNDERLSVLRGRYDLADRLDNHNSAPNEYISGHAVTVNPTDPKKVTIRVGWPDPKSDQCSQELRAAVSYGAVEPVAAALRAGASVHEPGPAGGWLPIHTAASLGNLGVLKLLIEHEADIHEATSRLGAQPIHLAAKEGHLETLEYLLELGADINAKDRNWKTPVSLACQKGHLEVVEFLADFDADLTACDEGRATPYDWSVCGLSYISDKYETYEKICESLRKRGAKVQGANLGPLDRCPYPSSRGPANC